MRVKRMALLVSALVFASAVSVCDAYVPGPGDYSYVDKDIYTGHFWNGGRQGVAYAASCKDGVCEFVPAADGTGTALAAINPYNNAVPDIEGQWEKDVKQLGPHDTFVAGSGESYAGVVFSVNNPIKNFKVLSLQFKDFGNDGKPVFQIKELYTKDVFRPDRQLLVKFTLFGSIPNNGISYTDPTGKTRYYTVDASGKDGSLLFTEF